MTALSYAHRRTAWQDPANPVTGPRQGPATAIAWWILHYRGVPGAPLPGDVFAALRGQQHWWTHRPTNRFSLGYDDVLVSGEGHPLDGQFIEVRGLDVRGAATAGLNMICWATQVMQLDGARLSPRAREACRRRSRELRAVFPNLARLADHGRSPSTTVTSCAGPGIRADIDAGLLWDPDPDPVEDDEMQPRFWRDERYHDVFMIYPSVAPVPSLPPGATPEVGRHHRTVRSLALTCGFTTLSRYAPGTSQDWAPVPIAQIPDEPG